MLPAISVIIAAHNEEAWIGRCLDALMPQLAADDELIVIDNNSTDSTARIAARFGAKVVAEPRQGLSFARNTGFRTARHHILARTDADTNVGKHWLDTIRQYYTTDLSGKELQAITGPAYVKELLPVKVGLHQRSVKRRLGHEILRGANHALTRTLWNRIAPILSNNDIDYAEDTEMSGVIFQAGGSIVFLPAMTADASGRRVIANPVKAYSAWRSKFNNTKKHLENGRPRDSKQP